MTDEYQEDFAFDPTELAKQFEYFVLGGFRCADFTEAMFEIITRTTVFGVINFEDQAAFWDSWFNTTTLEFREFVGALTILAYQPEQPKDSEVTHLLRMWGKIIASMQVLIDQTIQEFEYERIGQAADAEIKQEAEHYLGTLGATIEEVVDVLKEEYDYTEWWHKIPVRLNEDDEVLADRIRQALAARFTQEMKNPVSHPALFSLETAKETDQSEQFVDWNSDLARTRLTKRQRRRDENQDPTEGSNRDRPR